MEILRRIFEAIRAIIFILMRGTIFCDVEWEYD
jgi:hypothetical protein